MSVIGPRPALWNQDVLTAERDKYGAIGFLKYGKNVLVSRKASIYNPEQMVLGDRR